MKTQIFITAFIIMIFFSQKVLAQEQLTYQLPPKEIVEIIDAPPTPQISLQPQGEWLLVLERPNMPSIEIIAREEIGVAGLRIDPKTNSRSQFSFYNNLKLISIKDKKEFSIDGLPQNPKIQSVRWSPDGQKIAFVVLQNNGIELWMANTTDKKAVRLTQPVLNATISRSFDWMPDSKSLLVSVINTERGSMPVKSTVPAGPVVKENLGQKVQVRTYPDLIKSTFDEILFRYFTTSQLQLINIDGNIKNIGSKCIFKSFAVSPDAKYIVIEKINEPFSYSLPFNFFASTIEIWDISGNLVKTIADMPVANIPKGFDSVKKGPRMLNWRSDAAAELYWVEAQDEGDMNKQTDVRDKLFSLTAPFNNAPKEKFASKLRIVNITWGTENLAIITESWSKTRQQITSLFNPLQPEKGTTVLFDRSSEDAYNNPGQFVTVENESGMEVLLSTDNYKSLYLTGLGASPEGNRPFIDKFDLKSKKTTRLWQSEAPYYEIPVDVLDLKSNLILTRRESIKEQPNYFVRDFGKNKINQLTFFPHPYKNLQNINKQIIKYKRADGVELAGTLYLPYTDPEKNKNLPVLMWAYPQEFKSANAASQIKDSPYSFDPINWASPLVWLTQGYAVFDDFAMPIVGEGDAEPNDTYIEQLTADAQAAVDILVKMGVADKNRIAVGGHSYGAFMTANLLAHTNLFAAGIARSGAYNRTLTPFGFQREERTLWEALDTYNKMSPFNYADKLKTPILLIHGENDDNQGTFPIQSERFYNALMGHGATARLVMLPYEAHSYRARESVLHMLWETSVWLDKYVKNKK